MQTAGKLLLIFAGIINLLPLMGAASAARIQALYGVSFAGSDLSILLRHRGVSIAVVGGLLVAAAFRAELRTAAIIAGLVSMLCYIALALIEGGFNAELRRVVIFDAVAVVALVAAIFLLRAGPRLTA